MGVLGIPCDLAVWKDFVEANVGKVAVTVVFALLFAKYLLGATMGRRKLPPGPTPWPIIGNIASLSGLPHRSLEKLSRHYGGLMYLSLGSVPTIVVSTAEVARELFKNVDMIISNRPSGCFFENMTRCRNVTAARYGPHWRKLRMIAASELFTQKRLDAYKVSRLAEIGTSIKELFVQSDTEGPVDLHLWLHRLLSNNLSRVIINERYFGTDEKGMADALEFNNMTALMFAQGGEVVISDFIPWFAPLTKLQGKPQLYKKTGVLTMEIMRKMTKFDERRRLYNEGKTTGKQEDFVDVLLRSTLADGNQPMDDEIILLTLMDMLVAGTDTSATTIEWTIVELLRNPECMKKVRAELDSVVGNRLVKEEDLNNLPYLNAVLKESFRLHPATPLGLPREASQPFQLQGYTLPVGTRIFINQWAIHHDPAVYPDPYSFKPERFLEGPEINIVGDSQYQLIPFGAGRRNCVGLPMAILVIPLILTHCLHSIDFSLPEGQEAKDLDMSESFGVSAPKTQPLMIYARPRPPAALY